MVVTNPADLGRLPTWDAWFDADEVVHDGQSQTLTLRFAQEPGPSDDAPAPQLVRRSWLSKEYRSAFFDWHLVIHHVIDVRADAGWADMGMLEELRFDARRNLLSVHSNGVMSVTVGSLRAEASLSRERFRWMRRDVGVLGTSDSPW